MFLSNYIEPIKIVVTDEFQTNVGLYAGSVAAVWTVRMI